MGTTDHLGIVEYFGLRKGYWYTLHLTRTLFSFDELFPRDDRTIAAWAQDVQRD